MDQSKTKVLSYVILSNGYHFDVPFNIGLITIDQHLLAMFKVGDGFPLSMDNYPAFTISFDFEIVPISGMENLSNELEIILFG
ncbi:unnamed protein product [Rotaria sp. Silwood1]|nr:unnamed protein product [Rotaria sp. Silwood1]